MTVSKKLPATLATVVALLFVWCVAESFSQPAEKAAKESKAAPARIPAVALSKAHEAMCKVKVGDAMPEISSPELAPTAVPKRLASLFGEKATLVVFWKSDRRMCRELLADLGPEVVQPFSKSGVAVVGIAVHESPEKAQVTLKSVEADFPNLIDEDGKDFASVGSEKLPRTYLVDPKGKILWFDIEYSLGTRRELNQALRVVAGGPKVAK